MEEAARVVNHRDAEEIEQRKGAWGGYYKILTPSMRPAGGKLGVNLLRVPAGCVCLPFHYHTKEDEVYYILEGRGVLRYGDELRKVGPGDCISCPAGTKTAHQLANPYRSELRYLAIGNHEADEVCVYPDSGKTLVRSVGKIGYLEEAPYMDGEPERPSLLAMIEEAGLLEEGEAQ